MNESFPAVGRIISKIFNECGGMPEEGGKHVNKHMSTLLMFLIITANNKTSPPPYWKMIKNKNYYIYKREEKHV